MTTEAPSETFSALTLQEYIAIVRRRRAILLQAFFIILAIGVVVTLLTRPVYHASAKLLVDGPSYDLNTVDTANPLSQLLAMSQEQTADTQVEVLQTKPLLDEVNREVGPASLNVSIVKDTNVIEDDAEAGTPDRAANAANRLLDLYVAQDSDQSLNEIRQAIGFVTTQGAVARRNLNAAEDALADFKRRYRVADLDKNRDAEMTRIDALVDGFNKNLSDLAALQAQIAAAQRLLAGEPATLATRMAATNTEIASLQDQIRAMQVQREGLIQPGGYTTLAPPVRALDAQIADLSRRLAKEPALTVTESSSPNAVRESLRGQIAGMRTQAAALHAQAAETKRQLTQAQSEVGRFANWEVALDRLTRRRDDAQAQDAMFSDKLTDLTLREKARHATARIIEYAAPPTGPVRPKKMESILFAGVLGLCVGLCLALLQEFLDDRINTTADGEQTLGLPSLGHVPALTATDARLLPGVQGLDPAAESYRILRTNIHFAAIDAPQRTLLVTSSAPGEGKTTTAANLAFAMVADGRRVILVDTDLRRPTLHHLLELPAQPGLTDVLVGDAALEDALLEHHPMPGISVLPCGSVPPNPSEIVGSRAFRSLVETLTERADIVIFDSPPLMAAADAQILASQMDGTVLVVEAGQTRKASARRSLDLLRQARAHILGVAYNKMRLGSDSDYYAYYTSSRLPYAASAPQKILPVKRLNGTKPDGVE